MFANRRADRLKVLVYDGEPPSVVVERVLMARVGVAVAMTVLVDEEVAPTAL